MQTVNESKETYLRDLYYNPESDVAYSNIKNIWNKITEDIQN